MTPRIAIYARYSSDQQREASIEDQVRRAREEIQRRGWNPSGAQVIHDSAASGAGADRPGFALLLELVKAGKVDVVVAEDTSRISRDVVDVASFKRLAEHTAVRLILVADGIDTAQGNAKLPYLLKGLMSELFLDDLRYKTLRGLEGRALAGMSTGGLPYGYLSETVVGPSGRVTGHRIQVDAARADVVRAIFAQYLEGRSLSAIARELNRREVESPRARSRHQRKGWCAGTIRALLHNKKYTGAWTFKATRWTKAPGSNKRRPQRRPASEQIRHDHPDLRIIDDETWHEVQRRLEAVRAKYTRTPEGEPKGRAIAGRATTYPLSGLLFCGACGNAMAVYGGSSASYVRCSRAMKRGTCSNRTSVREDVLRTCIFAAIHEELVGEDGIVSVRKRIAEHLGELNRRRHEQLAERRDRLRRTEARVANLISFLAEGERSDAVVLALRDLEVQAKAEKDAISGLEREGAAPVRLPSPAEVLRRVVNLENRIRADPTAGRELMRRLLKDGQIVLKPGADGVYSAAGELLPVVLFLETRPPGEGSSPGPAAMFYSGSSGGLLQGLYDAITLAFLVPRVERPRPER
jgi:DNA invertase Pin-like site-specific DNA recombinase